MSDQKNVSEDLDEIDVASLDGDMCALRDAVIEEMRRLHVITLRTFREELAEALATSGLSSHSTSASASYQQDAQPASGDLVSRVERVFRTAAKPDQAQAVTYLARTLGVPTADVRAALYQLVQAGTIYARAHMKSHLYYLTGFGPGDGRR